MSNESLDAVIEAAKKERRNRRINRAEELSIEISDAIQHAINEGYKVVWGYETIDHGVEVEVVLGDEDEEDE